MRIWPSAAVLAVLVSAGCGGGGGGTGPIPSTGRALITVTWPSRSRLIPVAANSVRVVLKRGGASIAAALLVRPAAGGQSSTTIDEVQSGLLVVEAEAFPSVDGTGVPQARGETPVTIIAGQTVSVPLTMDSTINRVEISGPPDLELLTGQSVSLVVTAKDTNGATVLTLPKTISWATSNDLLVSVTETGTVKGLAVTGQTPVTVSVSESESGKSDSVSVSVSPALSVSVTPSALECWIYSWRAFTVTVTGSPDQRVTWSVAEGAAGGTISADGIYIAPGIPGTYHVVATSVENPSKKGLAVVTVTTPSPPP